MGGGAGVSTRSRQLDRRRTLCLKQGLLSVCDLDTESPTQKNYSLQNMSLPGVLLLLFVNWQLSAPNLVVITTSDVKIWTRSHSCPCKCLFVCLFLLLLWFFVLQITLNIFFCRRKCVPDPTGQKKKKSICIMDFASC